MPWKFRNMVVDFCLGIIHQGAAVSSLTWCIFNTPRTIFHSITIAMEENIRTYGGQNTSLQCKLLIPCTNVHMNFLFEMMAAAPRVAAYIAAPAYKSSGSKRISTTNNIFTAGSYSGSQHMAFLQSHEYAHHWVKVVVHIPPYAEISPASRKQKITIRKWDITYCTYVFPPSD